MDDNPTVRRLANDRLTYFMGFPGTTLEQGMEQAMDDINQRFTYVAGKMYPDTSPWGGQGDAVAQRYIDEQEEFHGVDFEIFPVPGDPARVWVGPVDRLFPESTNKVLIADLIQAQEAHQIREIEAQSAPENKLEKAQMETEAQKRMFPDLTANPCVGAFMPADVRQSIDAQRQAAWDVTTETERAEVYEQIREEQRVDAEIKAAGAASRLENALKIGTRPGL